MSTSVRTIRIDDDTWARLQDEAAERGVSRNARIIELLGTVSFSGALRDVAECLDEPDELLALADQPKLAAWRAVDLREIASALVALARRWPR